MQESADGGLRKGKLLELIKNSGVIPGFGWRVIWVEGKRSVVFENYPTVGSVLGDERVAPKMGRQPTIFELGLHCVAVLHERGRDREFLYLLSEILRLNAKRPLAMVKLELDTPELFAKVDKLIKGHQRERRRQKRGRWETKRRGTFGSLRSNRSHIIGLKPDLNIDVTGGIGVT